MTELDENDIKELKKIFQMMDSCHSKLRKDVVHQLRGSTPNKISEKKFQDIVSAAKRVFDEWTKQLKLMKKLLK